MSLKKFVIFPFNGNGIEALDCVDNEKYEFIGFIDDDTSKRSEEYPVHSRAFLEKYEELFVLAVPGSDTSFRKRKEIINSLRIPHDKFITVIHPNASIGKKVVIGYNCLIMAGVVVTSNAQISNHVCILPNTVIHHDTLVNEYTLIGSNVVIAGGATIGENCYIGSGSSVIHGIHVGSTSLVGLGSNVIKHVSPDSKVVGNPARDLNREFI
jgi:sugar O-acyltransferase (sialic acid O-acetyltransferase NeuD family)